MLNLTRQERGILLFIGAVILTGLLISIFVKGLSPEIPRGVIFSKPPESRTQRAREKININIATREQLISLPGIGPALAERIIEYRKSQGPFFFEEDIRKVKGVGPGKYARFKDLIVME
ncbi:MAG: ComEA family DNA-binding protein [Candidatus Omnitrophica bacterium]|nr:ComEA family DNA-binding protein [Candidatus Omnitrophota bacterium]